MAIDPRRLRPSELCRLLNSTPLGEVINERQLHRHRVRAGMRIGDGRYVDLLRYVAWLVEIRHAPKPKKDEDPYALVKERARARAAAIALAGRDIGDLPEVVNAERKARAAGDFRFFCESYFPLTFSLAWSPDHLKVIAKIEQAVQRGGLFALAMPRASGKALALITPLKMPCGWTTMGEVRVGDRILDEKYQPCLVTFATEIQHGRDCFRVMTSDGDEIVCDAEHLWAVNGIVTTTRSMLGRTWTLPGGRQIIGVEPVPSVPVRCIQVDSPSSLYLAGRKMVPTHNTTVAECACIWAVLNGHRDFVCLIGSDEGHASDMLESIKMELDSNDLLLDDYPEVVFPIHCLDGIANRCAGQLYRGERTHIGWTAKEIVLPTIQPEGWPTNDTLRDFIRDDGMSKASGAIIKVAGITGRIRGLKTKRSDGVSIRPSLVVLDDPMTDQSARSPSQCATRESILAGAVLGLAGPGRKISGIMPCTVIRPGDMADNILNRDKHPEWNGERTKMIYAFPSNERLWQHYAEIRAESLRAGHGGAEATEFYRVHRDEMDAGAIVAWPERFNHDELSAIQHAMNLKLQDEAAFFAEYQNEPLPEDDVAADELTADEIAAKVNRMERRAVAIGCNHVTMFVDIQANVLFYVVTAWHDDFTGFVIDYGTYPDQKRAHFTLRDCRQTLAMETGAGLEGSIYAGLDALTKKLIGREWQRDDGAMMRIERCLIDANWGNSTDGMYQFCRQSQHAGVVMPSHGRFFGASSQPMSEHKRRPGDRTGLNWRIPNVSGKRAVRHVVFDTNYWKSFIHTRLAVAMGDRGCLSLFGDRAEQHRLFAEHVTAEYRVRTEGRGRTVDEWKLRPEHGDNHWFDCLVGCAVAASIQGVTLPTMPVETVQTRKRVSFADMQKRRKSQ